MVAFFVGPLSQVLGNRACNNAVANNAYTRMHFENENRYSVLQAQTHEDDHKGVAEFSIFDSPGDASQMQHQDKVEGLLMSCNVQSIHLYRFTT